MLGSPRRAAVIAVVSSTLLGLYTPGIALANGRFPRAQVVQPVPRESGNSRTLFVRTTFGLLVSHDAGDHWSWIREAAMGYQGEWDPPLTVTRDARVWLGMANGLHVLSEGGCGSREVPQLSGELVTDLTNTADDAWPIVATSSQGDHGEHPGHIWRTRDGVKFEALGTGLPNVHFDTLEIAPSRPARLYATGYLPGDPSPVHLWRSDDGGVTLTAVEAHVPRPGRLYIAAVDPRDPDRLLVRLLDDEGSDIVLSTDGGKTFKSTLHFATSNYGFGISRDGTTTYAASASAKDGVFVSHDRGATWAHGAALGTYGMRVDDHGTLWALSSPYLPDGFFIGSSRDGVSFTAHGTFAALDGALACDAGAALACPAAWSATRSAIVTATATASAGAPAPAASAVSMMSPVDASIPPAPPTTALDGGRGRRGGGRGCNGASCEGRARESGAAFVVVYVLVLAWLRRRRWSLRDPG